MLLDSAVRFGFDLWPMSLRELERVVRVKSEMLKAQDESAWMRSATETAYMVNMIGGAVEGRKWTAKQPIDLFNVWLGKNKDFSSAKERIARAKAKHEARKKREGRL